MVRKRLRWNEHRQNRMLRRKLDSIRERLQCEKELNRFLRKLLSGFAKENGILKDGYIVDWCDNCNHQVTLLWDVKVDGYKGYCPFCGHGMMMCDSCSGSCNYEYGTGICKHRYVEV